MMTHNAKSRPMTEDEIVAQAVVALIRLRQREGDVPDGADKVLACSMPRKEGLTITTGEAKKLLEFGVFVYGTIAEHYWKGSYGAPQAPYVEELLELMPDGSVRYSATLLPSRFAPDLKQGGAGA